MSALSKTTSTRRAGDMPCLCASCCQHIHSARCRVSAVNICTQGAGETACIYVTTLARLGANLPGLQPPLGVLWPTFLGAWLLPRLRVLSASALLSAASCPATCGDDSELYLLRFRMRLFSGRQPASTLRAQLLTARAICACRPPTVPSYVVSCS